MTKKLFYLFFLLPLVLLAQNVERDWTGTTLTVTNVVVEGTISGNFELEFESVAQMLAYDFSNTADGARIKCNGYNTANDELFGPDVFWDEDSTATSDGLSVFDPSIAGDGRLIRTFDKGISITWSGYKPTADGDETAASANDTAWSNMKTYLDSNPNTVTIPHIEGKVFYYSADQEASADCTYVLEGTIKKKQDTLAHGFEVPDGIDNVTLTGTGTIHGNAVVDQVRAGGNAILATNNENFNILGRIQVYHCEGFAVNIRSPINMTIDGMYIRNTYGSVKSGDNVSGVNMDGIHLHSPREVVVRNCDIKSVDDCIAVTVLDTDTQDSRGVMITNCILEPVAAENSAAAGDGSDEFIIGAGIRIATDVTSDPYPTPPTVVLRDITVSDCMVIGGDSGMLVGTTGFTSLNKWVERLQVSNMHFLNIGNANYGSITAFADAGGGQVTVTSAGHGLAENDLVSINGTTSYNGDFTATNVTANDFEITDTWVADDATGTWASNPDMEFQRAIAGGIFIRGIKDSVFDNITFTNPGVTAINAGIMENVRFSNMLAVGGVVDNGNHAVNGNYERAHYLIRGSQNASDRVYVQNLHSVDSDGAGFSIYHNGGAGKEITNLYLQECLVDNPNQSGINDDDNSAVYMLNMDAAEIVEYDVDVINFTPSGSVIELARSGSVFFIEKQAPVNITAWHSDVYAAAGNWFTRIQLFTPTFAVDNHFEGFTNVLQVDQGTTHITGTAQAGAASTITLAAGESGLNGAFTGLTINLTGGTGSGQSKTITGYVGSTKVATVDTAWGTNPDATTTYEIEDAGGDGIYSVPLAGGNLNDKHVEAEFYIHVDSGSVNIIEDSTLDVVKDTITTTGQWLKINKRWAPDQTSTRLGFVAAETPTTFYLGPVLIREL